MKKQPKTIRKGTKWPIPPKDLTGMRFGKWVVQEYARKKFVHRTWLCRCDCGVQKYVHEANLVGKLSTQCCQCSWEKQKKVRTKSYLIWYRLKQSKLLSRRWQNYEIFRKAVGDPPSKNALLLRFNKFKPHAPGNTYWADSTSRHVRKKFKEKHILGSPNLMRIRKAKTRHEMARCMIAAKKAGYEYEIIGLAAGISRQRAHQIITKHLK